MLGEILKKRGDDPAAAAWSGYGLPQHALYRDHDVKFWLDVLVREGKLRPNQFDPEDIATNKYNDTAQPPGPDSAHGTRLDPGHDKPDAAHY